MQTGKRTSCLLFSCQVVHQEECVSARFAFLDDAISQSELITSTLLANDSPNPTRGSADSVLLWCGGRTSDTPSEKD